MQVLSASPRSQAMSFKVSDVQEYFDTLDKRFMPDGAKGVSATYQFNLDPAGTWHVNVEDGSFTVHQGEAEKATTTFIMKGDDYVAMVNGDLNGQMAFMTGKMKIKGAIPMAMKLKQIFPQS
jgi:putative sterol carrier protein